MTETLWPHARLRLGITEHIAIVPITDCATEEACAHTNRPTDERVPLDTDKLRPKRPLGAFGRFLMCLCSGLVFSGCASPKTHPGIQSFGTRAGVTIEHLATGAAKINALFDWKFGQITVSPGGVTIIPIEADGRPVAPSATPSGEK